MSKQKPQNTAGPDPREAELVENMILDAMEYIHGVGADVIVKELDNSTDTAATMAAIAYKTVRGVAENNRATARVDMDMDMMMGVTTEAIDMITEVAKAAGQIAPGSNVTQLKEDTLLRVTVLHGEQLGDDNGEFPAEMKQAASADMRDYMSDAGAQKAFDYVNNRAKAEGVNPNDMVRAGNEAMFGARNPLSEGVSQGLMAQNRPPKPNTPTTESKKGKLQEGYVPSVEEIQQHMDSQGGLMNNQEPPRMPNPLPTGQGIVPSDQRFPPAQDPNAEIAERRY